MVEDRLKDIWASPNWTSRPTHREIFMYCVEFLNQRYGKDGVYNPLANIFDNRVKIGLEGTNTNRASVDLVSTDAKILWSWMAETNRNYGSLSMIPQSLYLKYRLKIENCHNKELLREYELSTNALCDCAFLRSGRQEIWGLLRLHKNTDLAKNVISISKAILLENQWDILGILADVLDELGAENAAKHARTKVHCRACYAVTAGAEIGRTA
jgi:hypothetical protein